MQRYNSDWKGIEKIRASKGLKVKKEEKKRNASRKEV